MRGEVSVHICCVSEMFKYFFFISVFMIFNASSSSPPSLRPFFGSKFDVVCVQSVRQKKATDENAQKDGARPKATTENTHNLFFFHSTVKEKQKATDVFSRTNLANPSPIIVPVGTYGEEKKSASITYGPQLSVLRWSR